MRRYELMMILRPDVAEDRSKAILERTVRSRIALLRSSATSGCMIIMSS